MNFAEQISYWYLRLNGFFPLPNFVLHQEGEFRTSDADLVAIRLPHVAENIGGDDADWDARLQNGWNLDLRKSVALLVEVKSGRWDLEEITGRAADRKFYSAIRRTGFFDALGLDAVLVKMHGVALCQHRDISVGRLLVSAVPPRHGDIPWLHLSLDDAEEFIVARMRKFAGRKRPDRLFFQGDLIQYFAWKYGVTD